MASSITQALFKAITVVAIFSANGQTTFNCKAFQAKLEFNCKLTITPARASGNKASQPTSRFKTPFISPYHAVLFARHADGGQLAQQQLDRLRNIMRERRVIYSPPSPLK